MPTGYEVGMYQDITRIRVALESIADTLRSLNTVAAYLIDERGGDIEPEQEEGTKTS